ncbi:MAG: MBL fold metallo-hydrolase [Chloroflexi bacterium]|nr:MBL fold metallo-hydrolase [Chloroflexota bacterium]
MKQITASVFVEDRFSVPPDYRGSNPAAVVTPEGIVQVDTPYFPVDAVKWREEMARLGEIRYIVNSHHHIDHTTGNYFLPGIVVSHEGVKESMEAPFEVVMGTVGKRVQRAIQSGEGMVGYTRQIIGEKNPESLPFFTGYSFRKPTVTFTDKLNLYVGDARFELMHLPGHTAAHIGVYAPREKVFFAGDNFTYHSQPSFANCLPLEWVDSLRRVEALDIDLVVPGHGAVCRKEDVRDFRLFIQECVDLVKDALKRGLGREEAAAAIAFDKLHPGAVEGGLPVHLGPVMQRFNVYRLYDMLSGTGAGDKT